MLTKFKGLYPALATPMDVNGELAEGALRAIIESNIESGVHGWWVAGGTGESVLLDDEENMRVAEIVVDQAAGRANTIMHVGASTTKRAAKMAEHAAKVGAEAICCVPPFFYRPTDEGVVQHYKAVGEASDLPLFVYNLPQATGTEITPELMLKIQDSVPQLRGLKHSALTFGNIRTFADMGLDCFVGNCQLMLPALTIGACGMIDGPPNAVPEPWIDVWNAYQNGDWETAKSSQALATKIATVIRGGGGMHANIKALLSHRLNVECGSPRLPGLPLDNDQKEQLISDANSLGFGVLPS